MGGRAQLTTIIVKITILHALKAQVTLNHEAYIVHIISYKSLSSKEDTHQLTGYG